MKPLLFVDTGAWLALELRNDQYHQEAMAFAQNEARLFQWVTTNWVFAETVTMLRRRTRHSVALRFGNRIFASKGLWVVRIDAMHEERAWNIFAKYSDKTFGFVDCTSFAVMESLNMYRAFTFDRHFLQFGFQTLPTNLS